MSASGGLGEVLDRIVLSSPQQWRWRALLLLAAVGFLVLVPVSAGELHPVLTVFGLLLALVAAALPETNAPLALLLYLGVFWLVATPATLDIATLAAAAAVAVVQVAATLAASGPPGTHLDPALVRRWQVRTIGCLAAVVAVWLVALALSSPGPRPSGVVFGAALAVVAGWTAFVTVRLAWAHTRGDPPS